MGVSDDFNEECILAMLQSNMNISHLILYSQQVEETRVKRKSRDANKARSYDGGSSKGRLDLEE